MILEGICVNDIYDNPYWIRALFPKEIFAVGRSSAGIFLKDAPGAVFAILDNEDMLLVDDKFVLARMLFDSFPRMPIV